MTTYTVLLLRAEHITDDFGTDTYMTHVEADDAAQAEHLACWEAAEADFVEDESSFEEAVEQGDVDLSDYAVLLVIEGKHMDIKTS